MTNQFSQSDIGDWIFDVDPEIEQLRHRPALYLFVNGYLSPYLAYGMEPLESEHVVCYSPDLAGQGYTSTWIVPGTLNDD